MERPIPFALRPSREHRSGKEIAYRPSPLFHEPLRLQEPIPDASVPIMQSPTRVTP